jgi:hypothetical protein
MAAAQHDNHKPRVASLTPDFNLGIISLNLHFALKTQRHDKAANSFLV